jgi:hypothetical protein
MGRTHSFSSVLLCRLLIRIIGAAGREEQEDYGKFATVEKMVGLPAHDQQSIGSSMLTFQ